MISKSNSKTGRFCRVTFKLLAGAPPAETASVLGDWNDWSPSAHPLKKRKNGDLSVTVSIPAGRDYRFRYLVDDREWHTDEEADRREPNRFGGYDGVLEL